MAQMLFPATDAQLNGLLSYARLRRLVDDTADVRRDVVRAQEVEQAMKRGGDAYVKTSQAHALLHDAAKTISVIAARLKQVGIDTTDCLQWLWCVDLFSCSARLAAVPDYRDVSGVSSYDLVMCAMTIADGMFRFADPEVDDVAGKNSVGRVARLVLDVFSGRAAIWENAAMTLGQEAAIVAGYDFEDEFDVYARERVRQALAEVARSNGHIDADELKLQFTRLMAGFASLIDAHQDRVFDEDGAARMTFDVFAERLFGCMHADVLAVIADALAETEDGSGVGVKGLSGYCELYTRTPLSCAFMLPAGYDLDLQSMYAVLSGKVAA